MRKTNQTVSQNPKAAGKMHVGHHSHVWHRCTGKKYLSLKRDAPEEGREPMGAVYMKQ
jgi:hypothetical protein